MSHITTKLLVLPHILLKVFGLALQHGCTGEGISRLQTVSHELITLLAAVIILLANVPC